MTKTTFPDNATKLSYAALNFLFLRNPQRTSLGLVLGAFLEILTKILSPMLSQIEWVELSLLNTWHYLIIGVVLLYSRTIMTLFRNTSQFDEKTETAITLITKAEERGLPKTKINEMWMKLLQDTVANNHLSKATRQELEASDLLTPTAEPGQAVETGKANP